jgi:hypothetical protein
VEGAEEWIVIMEEADRDAVKLRRERPPPFLEDIHLRCATQRRQEILWDEFLGTKKIEVPRAPVSEVEGQGCAARQIVGPDFRDPAQ